MFFIITWLQVSLKYGRPGKIQICRFPFFVTFFFLNTPYKYDQ